jgi:predicted amidohydrolase
LIVKVLVTIITSQCYRRSTVRLALIQLTVGDNKEGNVDNALRCIDEAASYGVDLIALTERG